MEKSRSPTDDQAESEFSGPRILSIASAELDRAAPSNAHDEGDDTARRGTGTHRPSTCCICLSYVPIFEYRVTGPRVIILRVLYDRTTEANATEPRQVH